MECFNLVCSVPYRFYNQCTFTCLLMYYDPSLKADKM